MMPGVLVLVGVRQVGTCCDVIVSGFCGLVLLGCLGFLLFLGFASVFPLFPLFSCLGALLYTSYLLRSVFTLFINFLLTYQICFLFVFGSRRLQQVVFQNLGLVIQNK
jgi:hypothetical protein